VRVRAGTTLLGGLATLLAALSLHAALRAGWLPMTILTIAVAMAAGALVRRLPGPAPLLPLLTPLALVLLVTAACAPRHAWLGCIPTGATVTDLRALISAGGDDIAGYSPPAPYTDGLRLLLIAGVYVVAAAVDLLAVTGRRPVLAGIPLLALVVVPSAVRHGGVGVPAVLLAVAGWLLLLLADGRDRSRRWGRSLGPTGGQEVAVLGASAGRLGVLAVGAALLLPALVPQVSHDLLSGGGDPTGCCGSGNGKITVFAPLVTVSAQLQQSATAELLTVRTDHPDYLRLTSLDAFDGNEFTIQTESAQRPSPVQDGVPAPVPAAASVSVHATVSIGDRLAEHYLPLPYDPVAVRPSEGRWVLLGRLRTVISQSTRDDTRNLTVQVTSAVPAPSVAQLRASASSIASDPARLGIDLSLPTALSFLTAQAGAVTGGATSDYDRALALETYLSRTGGFSYDTTVTPAKGAAGVQEFLTAKRGFCQQFASTYVLMARSLGLVSRVAVGFTPGTRMADGAWHVTNKDAHAWAEVWFAGVGWVRFDPTPRPDTAGFDPTYSPRTGLPSTGGAVSAVPVPTPSTTARGASGKIDDPTTPASRAPAAPRAAAHHGHGWLVTLLAVLAVGLLLLVPALLRLLLRRRRLATTGDPSRVAQALWSELLDTAADVHLAVVGGSPRATGRSLALGLGSAGPSAGGRATAVRRGALAGTPGELIEAAPELDARAALDRLTRARERALFAADPGPVDADGLGRDAVLVRSSLLAATRGRRRVMALAAPPSVLAHLGGTAVARVGAVGAARRRAGARVIGAVLHRRHRG